MKSKNITLILLSITLAGHAAPGKNGQQKSDSAHQSSGVHSSGASTASHITNNNKQQSNVKRGGFGKTASAHPAGHGSGE